MNNPTPITHPDPQPQPVTPHANEITYEVDGEPQTTTEKVLTPRQILTNAGIDPAAHYLKLLRGESDQEHSYKDEMDVAIHMHPHMRFLAPSVGPTPVS
ncbi:MAG TPA: hypothetical protein VIK38_00105 [Coriobacteriia bacterium]